MKQFAALYRNLDQTTSTNRKLQALVDYFSGADPQDALWTIALFSHRRPRRTVTTTLLRQWAAESSGIPLWLFEASYDMVGDLAEAIALVTPPAEGPPTGKTIKDWIRLMQDLKDAEEEEKRMVILQAWRELDQDERFLFNKLITGGFRIGVSQKMVTKALSRVLNMEENAIAHRLMGNWTPDTTTYHDLFHSDSVLDDQSKPYPFYLAYALDFEPQELGPLEEWAAERKWDGIRGQYIQRGGHWFLWSRGEELVSDKFPELETLMEVLPPGTVLDGEIMPWKDETPMNFADLQKRIGRKNVSKKLMAEIPVIFKAYDLLEWKGQDVRERSYRERRNILDPLITALPSHFPIRLSPIVPANAWDELIAIRARAREEYCEGLMLKRWDSVYGTGRKKGDWWKWKIDPLTIDAVMIYAQRGHGRRASLFTDFTFAVLDGEQLVPFAKAYSGLTDAEFTEVNAFIRRNTLERFGPVAVVKPELVFEIAFEGIQASSRHKSGIALRFPRIKRWRKDKLRKEANTFQDLQEMLERYG